VTINHSWKFFKYGSFPYGLGNAITFTIHEAIAVKDFNFEDISKKTENAIVQGISL
jgi:1-acyl-sn-glycerol-3-phosphate acyltransferase